MEQTSAQIAGLVPGCLSLQVEGDTGSLLCPRLLSPAQAAPQAGGTDPCSQPLTSQGYAEGLRSGSSFLQLQTVTKICLTSYTIRNHGWGMGLAFL